VYTPERRTVFDNEFRTKTHGDGQLSLCRAVASLWQGGCGKLLGDINPVLCSEPSISITRIKRASAQSTAIMHCGAAVKTRISWGTHAITKFHETSRHVRWVDLHLEIREQDVFVTARVSVDTPGDRQPADWITKQSNAGEHRNIRNVSFDPTSTIRLKSSKAQSDKRAQKKKEKRSVYMFE
jgi:hypothetical protein